MVGLLRCADGEQALGALCLHSWLLLDPSFHGLQTWGTLCSGAVLKRMRCLARCTLHQVIPILRAGLVLLEQSGAVLPATQVQRFLTPPAS